MIMYQEAFRWCTYKLWECVTGNVPTKKVSLVETVHFIKKADYCHSLYGIKIKKIVYNFFPSPNPHFNNNYNKTCL